MILYTDINGEYILEVRNKVVFYENNGEVWLLETDDKLVNAYLNQIKDIYSNKKIE